MHMVQLYLLSLILPLSYALADEKTPFKTRGNPVVDLNTTIFYNISEFTATSQTTSTIPANRTCPFEMIDTPDGCQCQDDFGGILQCEDSEKHAIANPKILRAHWIGYANISGNRTLVAGLCKFCSSVYTREIGNYVQLNATFQCVDNRKGTLCSKCANGTAPAVNSRNYECVPCKKFNFFGYILLQIGCLSFLMLFIYIFDFFPASGALNAAVFFAQTITTTLQPNGVGFIPIQTISNHSRGVDDALDALYGIWNVVFVNPLIPPFCYFEQMNSMMIVLVVNCTIAFLPLLLLIGLILLVHILRECCGRFLKPYDQFSSLLGSLISCGPGPFFMKLTGFDAKKSKQTLFASALFLSYTKFFISILYILTPTTLVYPNGSYADMVIYLDGEWGFFRAQHLYYAVPALCIGAFMLIGFPLSLLILRYDKDRDTGTQVPQSKQARFASFCSRMLDHYLLYPFQKDFQWGHRKRKPCSGVKLWKLSWGLHDYRWMAGWYFMLRLALFATFIISTEFMVQLVVQQLLCVLGVIMSVSLRPYRLWLHNRIDACVFLLLASINTLSMYQYHWTSTDKKLSRWAFIVQYSIAFIPAAMMAGYFFIKLRLNWMKKGLALPAVGADFGNELSFDSDGEAHEGNIRHQNINTSIKSRGVFLSSVDTVHRPPLMPIDEEINGADLPQNEEEDLLAHAHPKKKCTCMQLCSCSDPDNAINP